MRQGEKLTKAKKIKMAREVCELYATDQYTLVECLKSVGIAGDATWSNWNRDIKEIKDLYENAKIEREKSFSERIKMKARTAFEKRIEGFFIDTEETIIENFSYTKEVDGEIEVLSKPVIKQKKKGKKYYPPSDVLIQVALYNKDPENFKDKRNLQLSNADGSNLNMGWAALSAAAAEKESSGQNLTDDDSDDL